MIPRPWRLGQQQENVASVLGEKRTVAIRGPAPKERLFQLVERTLDRVEVHNRPTAAEC